MEDFVFDGFDCKTDNSTSTEIAEKGSFLDFAEGYDYSDSKCVKKAKKAKKAAKSLKNVFKRAKQMLKSGNLSNIKALVERYVNSVTIYKNEIIIEFNIFGEFTVREAFSG